MLYKTLNSFSQNFFKKKRKGKETDAVMFQRVLLLSSDGL